MRFLHSTCCRTYNNNNVCMYTQATLEYLCLESPGRFCHDELGVESLVFSLYFFYFLSLYLYSLLFPSPFSYLVSRSSLRHPYAFRILFPG